MFNWILNKSNLKLRREMGLNKMYLKTKKQNLNGKFWKYVFVFVNFEKNGEKFLAKFKKNWKKWDLKKDQKFWKIIQEKNFEEKIDL